jgi:hypothetical protein
VGVVGEPGAWAIASMNSRSSPPTYIGDYRALQRSVCCAGAIAQAKVLREYILPALTVIYLSIFEWFYNTLETFRSLGACVISV